MKWIKNETGLSAIPWSEFDFQQITRDSAAYPTKEESSVHFYQSPVLRLKVLPDQPSSNASSQDIQRISPVCCPAGLII